MDKELKENTEFSHYRIVSKIGSGGMGEVYLAQDTKLDRKVAIKFLHHELSKDADKLSRFIQEAKAVSALNHPNILTVHEIGEKDDSNYIVTEYIEGKTLREHLSHKERLQLNSILKIGVQVSEALSAAHQAGIIHRDIKPENIMIRKDGYAKVLDFGLAKLSEQRGERETRGRGEGVTGSDGESNTLIAASPRLPIAASPRLPVRGSVNTTPGMVMGTVSYMSPEQARGNPTDARTDIWSLGVVLYEMLAGKVPFSGETVNHTIVSILEKEPLQLENVPGELQRIVRKSLTKDVDMRYQSARDMLIDLKNLRRELDIQGELERSVVPHRETTDTTTENATQMLSGGGESTTSGQNAATQNVTTSSSSLEYAVTQAKSHKLTTALAALLVIGVVSAVGYFGFLSKGSSSGQIDSIAVLPFQNVSADPGFEYLSDGIAESLINSLTQIQQLKVIARNTAFRYKGKDVDAKQIGRELGVRAVLTGRLRQVGDRLSIQVDLVDAVTGAQLWGEEYERPVTDALSIKQAIARQVTEKLRLRLSGEQEQQMVRRETSNADAYQSYLRGRYYWNRRSVDGIKKAITEFQQAVDSDPSYALGHVGLADCYLVLEEYAGTPATETLPKAQAAADRALQIDPSLAEAHASKGLLYHNQWRWAESEQEFKRAIELNPKYATTRHWYSIYLRAKGRHVDGLREMKIAQELDPLAPNISQNLAMMYMLNDDVESAIREWQKVIELEPNFAPAHANLGTAYLRQRRYEEALAACQRAVELSGRTSLFLSQLGYAYAVTGKKAEAIQILKEMEERYAGGESVGQYLARVHAGLGDKDQAFVWLEKDFKNRSGLLSTITWWQFYEDLRSDPRYTDLVRRMNLTE